MEIVYIWICLAAFFTIRLFSEIGSFGKGWATLSGDAMLDKVLTESRDATYYKGKGSPRDSMSKELLQEIWERDKGRCIHCGAECYLGRRSSQDMQTGRRKAYYGHWIPNAIGGHEVAENLHISCDDCNREMGSALILRPAIEFAAKRKETICTEGLIVDPECNTVLEFNHKQRRAA